MRRSSNFGWNIIFTRPKTGNFCPTIASCHHLDHLPILLILFIWDPVFRWDSRVGPTWIQMISVWDPRLVGPRLTEPVGTGPPRYVNRFSSHLKPCLQIRVRFTGKLDWFFSSQKPPGSRYKKPWVGPTILWSGIHD
jgi:hypothetical protein